jgi:GxxExxY protein
MSQITTEQLRQMAQRVYLELGADQEELIYKHAMLVELREAGYRCDCEQIVEVRYKGCYVGYTRADIILRCPSDKHVLLELKVKGSIAAGDKQQARNYMKGLGIQRGFVVNFPGAKDPPKRTPKKKGAGAAEPETVAVEPKATVAEVLPKE